MQVKKNRNVQQKDAYEGARSRKDVLKVSKDEFEEFVSNKSKKVIESKKK